MRFKVRPLFVVLGILALALVLERPRLAPDFSVADRIASGMIADLNAQAGAPITNGGQVATTGALSSATGSTTGPGAIVLAAPASTARHYIINAQCFNTSATATVASIWDSGTVGTAPTVVLLDYVECPANSLTPAIVQFVSPVRVRLGSAVGMSTIVSVATAYVRAQSYIAR
jgi:hypothetical protein